MSTTNSPSVMRTKLARISKASYAVLSARAEANNTSIEVEVNKLLGMEEPKQLEFMVTPTVMRVPPTQRLVVPPRLTQPGIVRQITPGVVRRE